MCGNMFPKEFTIDIQWSNGPLWYVFFQTGFGKKEPLLFLLKEMTDWTPSVLTEVYWKAMARPLSISDVQHLRDHTVLLFNDGTEKWKLVYWFSFFPIAWLLVIQMKQNIRTCALNVCVSNASQDLEWPLLHQCAVQWLDVEKWEEVESVPIWLWLAVLVSGLHAGYHCPCLHAWMWHKCFCCLLVGSSLFFM